MLNTYLPDYLCFVPSLRSREADDRLKIACQAILGRSETAGQQSGGEYKKIKMRRCV